MKITRAAIDRLARELVYCQSLHKLCPLAFSSMARAITRSTDMEPSSIFRFFHQLGYFDINPGELENWTDRYQYLRKQWMRQAR